MPPSDGEKSSTSRPHSEHASPYALPLSHKGLKLVKYTPPQMNGVYNFGGDSSSQPNIFRRNARGAVSNRNSATKGPLGASSQGSQQLSFLQANALLDKSELYSSQSLPYVPQLQTLMLSELSQFEVESQEFLDSLIVDDNAKKDLIMNNLLLSSDAFVKRAHELVLDTNDLVGSKAYFKLIKLAIKALLLLVKSYDYCMSPQLELAVYFKLAKLYFYETENVDKGDMYINMAIAVASRNNLLKMKFVSEFLASRILEKTNPALFLKYLNDRISSYNEIGLNGLADVLVILKINYLLVNGPTTGVVLLQALSANPTLNPIIRTLGTLYQCTLHLHRGSPVEAKVLLDKLASSVESLGIEYPSQIRAMHFLCLFAFFVQTNDHDGGKKVLREIANFIKGEREKEWSTWKPDGSFKLTIPLDEALGSRSFSFLITWLNSDEFVVVYYFLSGVHYIMDASKSGRAEKVFEACLKIIDTQMMELTKVTKSKRNFAIDHLTNKIVRLSYIRYSVAYYQAWYSFMNNDFTGITTLESFVKALNSDEFTTEELCYYKLLIPRILYLLGIYSHYKGKSSAAKNYFLKVRNWTVLDTMKKSLDASPLQLALGIGCESLSPESEFSELFTYSTFHLVLLTEFELRCLSAEVDSNPAKAFEVEKCHLFLTALYHDLTKIFDSKDKVTSNSFTMNFANSNKLLVICYRAILSTYTLNPLSGTVKQESVALASSYGQLLAKMLENSYISKGASFVKALVLYLIYQGSLQLKERNAYFKKCIAQMSHASDNDKIMALFVLREMLQRSQQNGENDKSEFLTLQIKTITDAVSTKFLPP